MTRTTQAGLKAAADAASRLIFFLIVIAAARSLDAEGFGLFSLAWTLGWLLSVAADAGLSLHLARELARSPETPGAIFRPALRIRAMNTGVAALVAALVVTGGLGGASAGAFLLLVLAQMTTSQTEFVHHLFRGLSRTEIESGVTLGGRLLQLVSVLAVLVWRVSSPSLGSLAVALMASSLVTLAAALLAAGLIGAFAGGPERPISRHVFLSDVLPIGLAALLSALYFRLDVFVLEHWRGAGTVGMYNAAFRVIEALRLLPAAILAVWFPVLCRAHDRRPLARIAVVTGAGGLALLACLWPISGWLITTLYGAGFASAGPAFAVLLLSLPLLFLNIALTHQLVAWNRTWPFVAVCLAALVTNLACTLALVPGQGMTGAAWATLVTELVVTAGALVALAGRRIASARAGVDAPVVEVGS